jgi:hypothetical protein
MATNVDVVGAPYLDARMTITAWSTVRLDFHHVFWYVPILFGSLHFGRLLVCNILRVVVAAAGVLIPHFKPRVDVYILLNAGDVPLTT